jgi:hypothetical protein
MRDGVAAGGAERCAADDAWAFLMLLGRAGVLECWSGCGGGVMRDCVAADRCRRAGELACWLSLWVPTREVRTVPAMQGRRTAESPGSWPQLPPWPRCLIVREGCGGAHLRADARRRTLEASKDSRAREGPAECGKPGPRALMVVGPSEGLRVKRRREGLRPRMRPVGA